MSTRGPHEDRGHYGPLWRDVAPSVLIMLEIGAVMAVLALVWTQDAGTPTAEP